MLKFLNIESSNTYIDVRKSSLMLILLAVSLFLMLSMILANRNIGIALDDYNYLNHFLLSEKIEFNNSLVFYLEEPIWKVYTYIITKFISSEDAFKFTIFISSFLFLISVCKIDFKLFFIVSVFFVFHEHLATQMYFNQLRQGVALSIFLFASVFFKRPLVGALSASFIHASFFLPLLMIFLILNVKSLKAIIFFSIFGVLALYFSLGIIENLDVGRRTDSYLFEGKFTINYYVITILRYIPILYILFNIKGSFNKSFFYRLSCVSFLFIVPFTLFYNAAGRLMYFVTVFFLITILEHFESQKGKLCLAYYFLFLILDLLIFQSTVIDDWIQIFK